MEAKDNFFDKIIYIDYIIFKNPRLEFMKTPLSIDILLKEAKVFCDIESEYENEELFGITDGKAVGTFIEQKFRHYLFDKYIFIQGSSAKGIDFPEDNINTDVKVTSIIQPQSSCPFRDARQKIYGLGYNILLFVYDKKDNPIKKTTILNFLNCVFIDKKRTADYQTTFSIRQRLENNANRDDIFADLMDRNLPAEEITLNQLVDEILVNPPEQGYLTISNALQWRLQYGRVVALKDKVDGVRKIIERTNEI